MLIEPVIRMTGRLLEVIVCSYVVISFLEEPLNTGLFPLKINTGH